MIHLAFLQWQAKVALSIGIKNLKRMKKKPIRKQNHLKESMRKGYV